MKLPTINNRELLPIRLIPVVLGFNLFPLDLAKLLAHKVGLAWPALRPEDELFAYHLDNEDFPAKMLPHEWGNFVSDIEVVARKFKLQETFEDENYRPWRLEALKLLPARVFVWRDEFESVFQASFNRNGRTYSENANVGTKELSFYPFIEPQYLPVVWEGFEALGLKQPAIDTQLTTENNRVSAKMRSKIEVSFSDFIRLFQITNPKHWERGLRLNDKGIWIVPTLNGDFAPEELAFLNEHPTKNTRKPVLTFPCTLKQLDAFIKDQGLTGYVNPVDLDHFIQQEIGKILPAGKKCSGKTVKLSKPVSQRSDLLMEEITTAIESCGEDRNPKKIMGKLKEYAGAEGSCIMRAIPGGIVWRGRLGIEKEFDMEAEAT